MTLPRSVELLPHDPHYAVHAADEAKRILDALGSVIVRVEHVGSTAIPSIRAKPTIDLLPVVVSVEALDMHKSVFVDLGYEWRGEFGLPGRRFFVRNDSAGRRLFNVHCWAVDHEAIARHIAFRDYLRAHPDEAESYETTKLRAAAEFPNDLAKYAEAKADWIVACQTRALAWVACQ